MAQMTDIMVDLETTGLDPHMNGIIQLGAIKFNLDTFEIGGLFDRVPSLMPFRLWDEGTKEFWLIKHREIYNGLMMRQEQYQPVYESFDRWAREDQPDEGYRVWAKPSKFDWPLLESHMIQAGLNMPFDHRASRDLNSYIGGLMGSAARPELDVVFNGTPHNALHDCAYQIDLLFHAAKRYISTEIV